MLPELRLKIRVHGRHPWFFRKMIQRPERVVPAGSCVRVVDRDGRAVGIGFYNPRTELALRMVAREGDAHASEDADAMLAALLDAALALREDVLQLPKVSDGYRLVHADGDGFPGLILDKLGDAIVAQVFSLAVQKRIERIGERLLARWPRSRLVLTIDPTAKEREGLENVPPPGRVEVEVVEHGVRYAVRAGHGHKTGFFADQRDNRQLVRRLAKGRRVLDLCCNAGGFALNAVRGGAREVVALDLDEASVERTRENAARNDCRLEVRHGDAFDALRELRPNGFDLLVLDPPKWANGKDELEDGARRYFDFNRLAFDRAPRGALVLSCSCSGALSEARFLAILRDAAAEAGRDVRVLELRGAGPDHPVALECAETRYLKAVLMELR
ncbi:MAG: class I SAM-dependent rRNA methyltransferase [Planctomycetes bacterium]|nr:class I SAM-dependent rRNA methyltransferase [Planctomycetota bacterium]